MSTLNFSSLTLKWEFNLKLLIKLIFFVLIVAVLLPFTFLKGQDGQTLMNFSDISFPYDSFSDLLGTNVPVIDDLKGLIIISGPIRDSNQIYKWIDIDGNLHFTNSPPAGNIKYTVKGYNPDQNLIQAVSVEPEVGQLVVDSVAKEKTEGKTRGTNKVGNPYSVKKVERLFKDAEGIESLLNNRLKQQQTIIGQ